MTCFHSRWNNDNCSRSHLQFCQISSWSFGKAKPHQASVLSWIRVVRWDSRSHTRPVPSNFTLQKQTKPLSCKMVFSNQIGVFKLKGLYIYIYIYTYIYIYIYLKNKHTKTYTEAGALNRCPDLSCHD